MRLLLLGCWCTWLLLIVLLSCGCGGGGLSLARGWLGWLVDATTLLLLVLLQGSR